MPSYKFRAIYRDGAIEQCETMAESREELHREYEAKGAFIDQVKEVRQYQWSLLQKKYVNDKQLYLFIHEFIALVRAGVTIPDTLQYLAKRPAQPYLSRVLQDVRQRLVNGESLSSSMASYPGVFDRMFVNAVMIGEKNGKLVDSLDSYLSYLKLKIAIQQKLRAALVYPAFLSVILIVTVAILFFFVMPRFTVMYAEFDAALPYPTQLLMTLVDYSHVILPVIIGLSLLLIAGFKYWLSRRNGKIQLDKALLSLPVIRNVAVPFVISSNASALETLLSVGMPLVEALKAISRSSNNSYMAKKLEQAAQRMAEGKGFADTMRELRIMDESALTMVGAGEKSGQLIPILGEIARFNSERLNEVVTRHLALIEPLLMLVMGLVVGGIIFVMYLPIFSIAEVIK